MTGKSDDLVERLRAPRAGDALEIACALDDLCVEASTRIEQLTARAEAAEAEVARLREALRDQFCPRPCNGRPDKFDVGDCVDAGECGCSAAPALAFQERA